VGNKVHWNDVDNSDIPGMLLCALIFLAPQDHAMVSSHFLTTWTNGVKRVYNK
jgi:hypothetical protein